MGGLGQADDRSERAMAFFLLENYFVDPPGRRLQDFDQRIDADMRSMSGLSTLIISCGSGISASLRPIRFRSRMRIERAKNVHSDGPGNKKEVE